MVIAGRNPVLESLSRPQKPEKIFISYGAEGDVIETIRIRAKQHGIPCAIMDKRKFGEMEQRELGHESGFRPGRSQGVIALVSGISTLSVTQLLEKAYSETEIPIILALDGITDPHNLGAISRTAECIGAQGLILPEKNSAPLTASAIKASAGALEFLPIAKTESLVRALTDARNAGFEILGTSDKASRPYTQAEVSEALIVVIGSEGSGMSEAVQKLCTQVVSIPMLGKISSLNASVASGVLLFDIIRRRAELNTK